MAEGDYERWVSEVLTERDARITALEAEVALFRRKLDNLQLFEADYRKAHDIHGDGSAQAGRAWDLMRRAGDEARAALRPQP